MESVRRDIVTVYGRPTTETVAVRVAAAVESTRESEKGQSDTMHHLRCQPSEARSAMRAS